VPQPALERSGGAVSARAAAPLPDGGGRALPRSGTGAGGSERTRPSGEAGRPAGSRAKAAGAPRREMRLRSGWLLAALCLGAAFPLLWYAAWEGSRGESRRRAELVKLVLFSANKLENSP